MVVVRLHQGRCVRRGRQGAAAGAAVAAERAARAAAGVRRHGRHRAQRRAAARRAGAPVRVSALRQALPLEVHAAAPRERGVRRQGARAPVPALRLPRQAARQPGRAHPQAPHGRVVSVRRQQDAPQQEGARLNAPK